MDKFGAQANRFASLENTVTDLNKRMLKFEMKAGLTDGKEAVNENAGQVEPEGMQLIMNSVSKAIVDVSIRLQSIVDGKIKHLQE